VKVEADGSSILANPEWFTATVANPVMRQVWLKPILKAATSLVTPSVCVSTPAGSATPPAGNTGEGEGTGGAADRERTAETQGRGNPADDSSFRPASETATRFDFSSLKRLRAFLTQHPEVRTSRPISLESGEPNPQRLLVHIGDLAQAMETGVAPLDQPAATVDAAIEIEKRKAEVQARHRK